MPSIEEREAQESMPFGQEVSGRIIGVGLEEVTNVLFKPPVVEMEMGTVLRRSNMESPRTGPFVIPVSTCSMMKIC